MLFLNRKFSQRVIFSLLKRLCHVDLIFVDMRGQIDLVKTAAVLHFPTAAPTEKFVSK